MDSLTQIVLGAAVGEVALGRKLGNRAMLWGALAGTIPDLDVLAKSFTDDLTANEWHRGFSHSILFSVLLAPVMGWLWPKLFPGSRADQADWTKLFFWGLFTHPLLDVFTTWGTQLFWPFDIRLAIKSVNVVDPLYTIPFLICLLIAVWFRREKPVRRKLAIAGLVYSSTYLIVLLGVKWNMHQSMKGAILEHGIEIERLTVQPTFANGLLWYGTVENQEEYVLTLRSVMDEGPFDEFFRYKKNLELRRKLQDNKTFRRLENLSTGYYLVEGGSDSFDFSDLRFGKMTFTPAPDFVFKYNVTRKGDSYHVKQGEPPRDGMKDFLRSLWTRLWGRRGG